MILFAAAGRPRFGCRATCFGCGVRDFPRSRSEMPHVQHDIFAWFIRTAFPADYAERAKTLDRTPHEYLTDLAAEQRVGGHGLIALDWHSGNRSVLVDHDLSGVLVGQTLSTRPEDIYRALLEATAFGTRTIIDAFEAAGVPVEELIVAGGLTKNALLMQIYADVTRRPLGVIGSAQGPALGAAMHAAVAAGAYDDIRAAAHSMGKVHRGVYLPDPERAAAYDRLYEEYRLLHDYFGRGVNDVMHRLRRIRAEATA
jgi:L-ribulokinase